MNSAPEKLAAGLYLIATPLGAARDITLRALDILRLSDVLVAEDTRSLRKLMDLHGIPTNGRQVIAYHDHNGAKIRPKLLAQLAAGKAVVYASEAGTPMIADPGFDLARAAVAEGFALVSAPGPSAVIAALTVSGLPTDRFFFAGFLPPSSGKRKTALAELAAVPGTLIFYESSNRLAAMLQDAALTLGEGRRASICRELTKKFEEVLQGSLSDLASAVAARKLKGEIVVLIDRAAAQDHDPAAVETDLKEALERMSVKDAAALVSEKYGLKKRLVYQKALELLDEE